MHVIVCVKQVIDTERVSIDPRSQSIIRKEETSYINPYDLRALDLAMALKKTYAAKVTAISMGPHMGEAVLREALAMGADRGILLTDKRFAAADTLATSYVLGMGIRRLGEFDLLLCGAQSADSGTAQVGPQLAEELNLPQITMADKIEQVDDHFRVERWSDGYHQVMEVTAPVLVTIGQSANIVQLPGLTDIQDAFASKEVELWGLDDLAADTEKVGLPGSGTWVVGFERITRDRTCEFIEGDLRQQVQALMDKLTQKHLIG
ncbi:MAG: electron transfer flavoprotein subunit beta/FixA family protein [Deltaproteobacteria bacterium]|nr:electron transfer flavoprotein subunit beta/FixA family protein [Deltaproteobacteria bacterium]